ncbi:MFS transporter [Corynebacterium guangdongense]|uniref:MFS family permease n=1 Tax=Corynebacterium guangdongense TaxID=1783348 RepID=A0ABU1ZVQ5_9CORY|nr:MFS transporter [Corynebacterium guangdongense]MDR7329014.1 MFS family permease [Corynebacterium guangdongense]
MFATNGATFASILPWYPVLKETWGLSDAVFGVFVTAMAIGSLLSTVLPAWAERRFGPRPTVFYGTVLLALVLVGFGLSDGPWIFALLLLAAGALDTVVDVSQNVTGVAVQDRLGRSIISSLHAFWSLGSVVGGLAATWAAATGVPIAVHLSAAAVVVVALAGAAVWMVGPVHQRVTGVDTPPGAQSEPPARDAGLGRVMVLALPVALLAGAGVIVEDVASNWAALAANQLAGVAVTSAGAAYTVVLAAQTLGRFTGDPLIDRFGRVGVARTGGLLIALGGLVVVTAGEPLPLYVGLALAGYGCATIVPSAYAAAAGIPGVRPSDGVTAVSWLMRVAMIVTSPIIGAVSEVTSLRVGLGVLLIAGALVTACAGALRAGPRAQSGDSAV